jgi:hypothetical protein
MRPFTSSAATVAWLAAAGGIAYGIAFAADNATAASLLLSIGAGLTVLIISALAASVEDTPTVRLAATIGIVGALASTSHGVYDLANRIHPPDVAVTGDLPNPVDPRGFATFALVGLALVVLSYPLARSPRYGNGLASAGRILGAISIVIFLGRLIILDPTNPVVRVALVAGVVANTVFLIGLARTWRASGAVATGELARTG